jgi:hypothetical protein
MRSVLGLSRISVLLSLVAWLAFAAPARGQDASGRPTGGGNTTQDDSGRPKPRKPKARPKKVIRARAADDVDKTPVSSVIIRSYPPGADVLVDGRDVGTTGDDGELELSDVKLGSHRIVLRKNGYREWAQTVNLKSSTQTEEIEPLLQSENPQFLRDVAKLPPVVFGKEITGQITRDSVATRDGKTFYNEYVMKVDTPDAYVILLRGRSVAPTLKLVDDSNVPYALERIGEEVYQSVFVPHPGYYYLQVVAPLDESSFTTGDYAFTVTEESEAHGAHPIAIGATESGTLAPTDRQTGPGDFYDAWTITGPAGSRVRIAAQTSGGFTPGLTLFLDGKVVASSAQPSARDKKKKKPDAEAAGASEIVTTLTGATYTVFVRSVAGPKTGAYQLSVTMGG